MQGYDAMDHLHFPEASSSKDPLGRGNYASTEHGIDTSILGGGWVTANPMSINPGDIDDTITSDESADSDDSIDEDEQPAEDGKAGRTKPKSKPKRRPSGPSGTSLRRGMACAFCRKRKLRCSGEKPMCSMCVKYKKECEYVAPPRKPGKRKAKAQSDDQPRTSQEGSTSSRQSTSNSAPPYPPLTNIELGGSFSNPSAGIPPAPVPFPQSLGANPNAHDASSFFDRSTTNQFSYAQNTGTSYQIPFNPDLNKYDSSPIPEMQSWSGYSLDLQDPMAWTNPFPTLNPSSVQTPTLPSHTPQQAYISSFQTPQTAPDPYRSSGMELPSAAFGPSPFVDAQSAVHVPTTAVPAGHDSTYRYPINLPSDSSLSTPSDGPHATLATSLPSTLTLGEEIKPVPDLSSLNGPETTHVTNTSRIDPIEGITERLGEFLFNPKEKQGSGAEGAKRRKPRNGYSTQPDSRDAMITRPGADEQDGLSDEVRDVLLDCFLAHCKLFFHMSIPRFKYRLQFTDRRRPSLALLNAMYLWATRMSSSPNMGAMEQTFFDNACRALDLNSANGDRLIDCLRAAMLLSAWSFTSGRFHEGWIISGMAVRLVLSTGLHQIKSCVFAPEPPTNPFLRNKVHLLPPLEDSTELAERIHTFWAVYVIDRCGAAATGFPVGIRVEDITTPFPRPMEDIVSGSVTHQDDITVKDLYRPAFFQPADDMWYAKFCRSVTLLERSSKLVLLEPDDDSEYTRQWSAYRLNPALPKPPAHLEQPKYRCLADYRETKLGLEQLLSAMGADGIWPMDRIRNAELDRAEMPYISPKYISLHHHFAATHMLLHDINSLECENKEGLAAARRSAYLLRNGPPLPSLEVDSFLITVWSMITKVLIKEVRRTFLIGDMSALLAVESDVNLFIQEMNSVGNFMQLARTQAKAMEEMRDSAKRPPSRQEMAADHLPRNIRNLNSSRVSRAGSDERVQTDMLERMPRLGGI